MTRQETIEVARDIAKDIWAGLKFGDVAMLGQALIYWLAGMRTFAFWFAALTLAVMICDAAINRRFAALWRARDIRATDGWRKSNELLQQMSDARIADMWFHVCLYTNFLQAPQDVPKWMSEAQRIYQERHMVN